MHFFGRHALSPWEAPNFAVLGQYGVPAPMPWPPEEECPADDAGLYGDRFLMGQAMTRPGPIGSYFDVPNGAFPVPWGPDCHDPEGCDRALLGSGIPARPLGLFH